MGIRKERVEVKTVEDVVKLLAPTETYAELMIATMEKDFREVVRFIDIVVEKGIEGDATVFKYIRSKGQEVRAAAYRLHLDLLDALDELRERFTKLGANLAEALGVREQETR
jgi:hypothetical protein